MKLWICAFACVCVVAVCLEAAPSSKKKKTWNWKCDKKDEASIDSMVARAIIMGHSEEKFPESTQDLKQLCDVRIVMLNRMESYKDTCVSGTSKQVLSVLVYSLRGMLNPYCRKLNSRKAKALIAGGSCYNAANLAKCITSAKDNYIAVLDAESKVKLSQLCCGYGDLLKCVSKQLELTCPEKHTETMIVFFKSAGDNSVNLLCGDLSDESDKCDSYPFVDKNTVRKQASKYKYESFFLPFLKIMQTL